jgi:2-succinyl-6-hydroxy-2,4-cyclohexadiene-1-carboxylate synthase
VDLHAELRGTGPPLVLLHGFTQTGRLWGTFGERLAESHTLVALDLPGHAGSDAVRADLPETAGLVAEAVRAVVGVGPCDVLGYSLGARVAMHVVTASRLSVDHVVLIGATAGIDDPAQRERRRAADNELADRLEASDNLEDFLEEWLRGPLFERLSSAAADRAERLRNSATGLAASLRSTGTGTQAPLWNELHDVPTPVLALAGADDNRFGAYALRVARTAPRAVASLVPGGGHAVHLAQPAQTWRIVEHWLTTAGSEV